jgi:putative membrane-bound dehydrogenase-like protein
LTILTTLFLLGLCAALPPTAWSQAEEQPPLKLLFLGDNGHHAPADRAAELMPALKRRGIEITYSQDVSSLEPGILRHYDGLIIYANIERISPDQEQALLDYVEQGGGLIALHSASFCFLNSPKYIALVGAQFQKHGGEIFRTEIAEPNHPVMRGFDGFSSWDETYIHHKHNETGRTVLEYRRQGGQAEGQEREPWTWVRTQGKGRVFYTAWGHDSRTFTEPGFVNLVERGIRWACGTDPSVVPAFVDHERFDPPAMAERPAELPEFSYVDVGAKIPNYVASNRWGALGDPITLMQQPLPPSESANRVVVPEGFRAELVTSELQVGGKPIAMTWDEQGRMWLCETMDYPNELQPRGQGRDRIRICEDTDGNGQYDSFRLFAEGLSIPTSLTFFRGGVVVQDGPETIYLKDTSGDGKADLRKVLISGWALNDTHGGVSNFRYGPDNWIWGMQGYNRSRPTSDGHEWSGFQQGFFRFRLTQTDPPKVEALEFLGSTNNNTWGLGFSEEGFAFGSTANHNPSVAMPIPNRYYEQVRGWSPSVLPMIADTHLFKPITERVRQVDHHGGYTAGAGHALYTARAYPSQWWNKTAFVCGPTGHLVGTFVIERDGAGFKSTSPINLFASDDEWSAPIMAEVGPDGHVWVLDWYNYIVQHNPTPRGFETGRGNAYETDLRDKRHGRVYRVAHTNAEPATTAAPDLTNSTPKELVAALRHSNMLWRLHAQRLLVERGESDVVDDLVTLISNPQVDALGLDVGAMHALWTLDGLGISGQANDPATQAVFLALSHESAGVRRAAAMVLPQTPEATGELLAAGLLNDIDAQVRLAALLALADAPPSESAGAALAKLLADPAIARDRWLADGFTSAVAMQSAGLFAALAQAETAALPPRSVQAVRIAAEHAARGSMTAEQLGTLIVQVQAMPTPLAEAVIDGLGRGWPNDHAIKITPEAEAALGPLVARLSPGGQATLVKLSLSWNTTGLREQMIAAARSLEKRVEDDRLAPAERLAAAKQLVNFQPESESAVEAILESITPQMPSDLAAGLIDTLTASKAESLGPELLDRAAAMTPALRRATLGVLMSRAELTEQLLDAIDGGKLRIEDLSLDQRSSLGSHPQQKIRERATALMARGGGLPSPDRAAVLEQMLPLAERTGDVALGREIYRKQCANCHRHSGQGGTIGPDLTGMVVHPKTELMVHIFDPNRSVEGNYRTYTVLTVDGRVLTGMLAAESRTTIEIVDAEAKREVVQREDVDELVPTGKSLMPEGFEKQMADDDVVNLLEFLTAKGKFVPLPLNRVATAVSTKSLFHEPENGPDRLVLDDWGPKEFRGVPFMPTDPRAGTQPNLIMLHGPLGTLPPRMPKSVKLDCQTSVKQIHMLGGISGWGFPAIPKRSVSMIVRLHYADGETEDHSLRNGVELADYIRRVDVPGSEFAFSLRGQQLRYLSIQPKRNEVIDAIEFVKGDDSSAPMVMAVTVERPDQPGGGH